MLKLSKSNWSSKFSRNQLQPTWTEASHNPKFSSNDQSQVDKRGYDDNDDDDDDDDDDAFMDSDEKGSINLGFVPSANLQTVENEFYQFRLNFSSISSIHHFCNASNIELAFSSCFFNSSLTSNYDLIALMVIIHINDDSGDI